MKQASWVFVLGACVVAAGCGQKGPLYLPDKNASVVTRPAGATTSAPAAQPTAAPPPANSGTAAPTPTKPPQDKNSDDSQSGTPKS